MTEQQKEYLLSISDNTLPAGERVDVYIPVVVGGEVIRDGNRRKHENQHIRLNPIDVAGKTVLDVGCNTGYISFRLKEKGAKYVLGVDKDPKVIRVCNTVKEYDGFTDIDFIEVDKGYFDPTYKDKVANPVLDSEHFPFDVGLIMSNWDIDATTHELGLFRHYAQVWYLEPTNHPSHYKSKEELVEYGVEKFKQFGDVEFLTYTDYQDRGLFKLKVK